MFVTLSAPLPRKRRRVFCVTLDTVMSIQQGDYRKESPSGLTLFLS